MIAYMAVWYMLYVQYDKYSQITFMNGNNNNYTAKRQKKNSWNNNKTETRNERMKI